MNTIYVIWKQKDGWKKEQEKIHLAFSKLKDAKNFLLKMLNEDFNTHYTNWGLAKANINISCNAWNNGASYSCDTWHWEIEEIETLPEWPNNKLLQYEGLTRREYETILDEQLKWNSMYN